MSYFCIDPECPNVEAVEKNTPCPQCGAKSESVSILEIQNLIYKKKKAKKFNDTILFNVGSSTEALTDKLTELLAELATIESAKYPKESDATRITVLVGKIQTLQIQILIESQLAFIATIKRLMGF